MFAEIKFSVQGHVKQRVYILEEYVRKNNYTLEQLQADLNSGKVVTTIQENGTVDLTESGEVIGGVKSVDNECEYTDFEVFPPLG